ncbi:MAG: hypothetical protein RL335_1626, partial [Bacteroidota bacterium]
NQFQLKIAERHVQLLDVRTIGEYNSGYIKNAFQADWTNQVQFFDRTQYLDKSKPVYVYCASGGRSAAATIALREKGFIAYNLSGGMIAWKRAGKPVEGVSMAGKLSATEYKRIIDQADLVLVDFGAVWCPPCKKMEPVVAELNKKKIVSIANVDGAVNTELLESSKVEAFPTFILYKKGKEVWRKQGIVTLAEFESVIKSTK